MVVWGLDWGSFILGNYRIGTRTMVPYIAFIVTVWGTSNRLQHSFGNYSGPVVVFGLSGAKV